MVMEEAREAVMEAPPSAQSVGREFVRQYYTLLNQSPACLHRFYGPDSSFLHGGMDPSNCETAAVYGQKEIHNKVQQLNFRDCHAKIIQVDSLATIGGGVVIQVTGELSNAGQPMRRFSQTFILAVKSAKSYYVYNDIFRYQDEIIADEEYSGEGHPEVEASEWTTDEYPISNDSQSVLGQPVVSAPVLPPFCGGGVVQAVAAPAPVQPVANQPAPPVVAPHQAPMPAQIVAAQSPQAVTLNGHPEDLGVLAGQPLSGHLPPVSRQFAAQPIVEPLNHAVVPAVIEEVRREIDTPAAETNTDTAYPDVAETEAEPEIPQEPATNEPKTYANRLKSTTAAPPTQAVFQQPINTFGSQPPSTNVSNNRPTTTTPGVGNAPVRFQFHRGSFPQSRNNGVQQNRGPRLNDDGDRRRSQSFGQSNDPNQLFLGNLPHAATEEQLRDIFSDFGPILEFKIFKTQAGGAKLGQGGRAPPNYAFITYESPENVTACLEAKPIYYPKNDSTGTLLNIELKRYGGGNNGVRLGGDNSGGRIGGRGGDSQRRGGNGSGGNRGGLNDRNRNQGDRYNRGSGGPGNRSSNNYARR